MARGVLVTERGSEPGTFSREKERRKGVTGSAFIQVQGGKGKETRRSAAFADHKERGGKGGGG